MKAISRQWTLHRCDQLAKISSSFEPDGGFTPRRIPRPAVSFPTPVRLSAAQMVQMQKLIVIMGKDGTVQDYIFNESHPPT
jgi:hypothetical protein